MGTDVGVVIGVPAGVPDVVGVEVAPGMAVAVGGGVAVAGRGVGVDGGSCRERKGKARNRRAWAARVGAGVGNGVVVGVAAFRSSDETAGRWTAEGDVAAEGVPDLPVTRGSARDGDGVP